jgi:hypothetical protein
LLGEDEPRRIAVNFARAAGASKKQRLNIESSHIVE